MKDEPVDILDEQGNQIGKVLMKSEVHAQGLWHGAAHLWIYNSKGEILLQKRAPTKKVWPNIWDVAVAGHIAAAETPKETLVKEGEEELGIKVTQDNMEFIGLYGYEDPVPPDGWMHRVFIWSYILETDLKVDDLVLEDSETSEVRWVHYDELDKEINDPKLSGQFSPKGKILFERAINEIRRRLSR